MIIIFAGGRSSKLFYQGCYKYRNITHAAHNKYDFDECKEYCKYSSKSFFMVADEIEHGKTMVCIPPIKEGSVFSNNRFRFKMNIIVLYKSFIS